MCANIFAHNFVLWDELNKKKEEDILSRFSIPYHTSQKQHDSPECDDLQNLHDITFQNVTNLDSKLFQVQFCVWALPWHSKKRTIRKKIRNRRGLRERESN